MQRKEREKGARQCQRCHCFTHEAMYLVRGREICATCGKEEIVFWNQLVKGSSQQLIKTLMVMAGSSCLFTLAACSDRNGGDTVNPQGVQNCTVTVNGKEKPCH